MIITPKIFGYICTTAHPTGCFENVEAQINYIKSQGQFEGCKNVLIIGASTGYGLASRIISTFCYEAKTVGIIFEKAADDKRTASPGWYNTAAFEKITEEHQYYAKTINGDAFSTQVKQQAAELIRNDLKKVDLVIYSLASPRRIHPVSGQTFNSVLKPIGHSYVGKTLDPFRCEVKDIAIEPATDDEISGTIAVMGGEDWEMWIDFLQKEQLLSEGVKTVAYTYIGSPITYAIYKDGTIGKAKEHLQKTADKINAKLKPLQGQSLISVNKAIVTQASSAIPVIPLYMSLLLKFMKANRTDEGAIEQINRLFKDYLYTDKALALDSEGRIRLDDLEMQADVQQQIITLWPKLTTQNVAELADLNEYCDKFSQLFGFNIAGVNYEADVDPVVKIDSL